MIKKRKLSVTHLAIYTVIFFAVWSIKELIIRGELSERFDTLSFEVITTTIKLLVWTLPAILLIRHFQDDMWISLKEMFTTKPQWVNEALIVAIVLVGIPLRAWFTFGKLAIHPDYIPATLIGAVIFVGITEETVFRGFLLNATLKKMQLWPAIALNSVLFTLIHYPIWIHYGYDLIKILTNSIGIMALSAIFAYSFVKAKNILVPIAIHMMNNLLVGIFFGS
jgi:membrane protease YdiL (CAAX protease family)